jgi:predicted RNA-binding Zn ribbon-like protein
MRSCNVSRCILNITRNETGDPAPGTAGRVPYAFELTAGARCLDFVNTLGNRRGPKPLEEHLAAYADLVDFAFQAGDLTADAAAALRAAGAGRPDEAGRVLDRAVALREALYRIFDPLARSGGADADGLAGLNAELRRALGHARIERRDEGYALAWEPPGSGPPELDTPLWPVARSAMELLLEADLSRLGECDSDTCGFLFLDTTRNKSRRWCDTRVCGNRARVRAHRHRRAGSGRAGRASAG